MDDYFHGYDLSLTGTGIVVLDENRKIVHSQKVTNSLTGVERLIHIKDIICSVIYRFPPVMICQEDYIMNGRNPGKAFHIGELGGVIKVALADRNLDPVLIGPTKLKKFITGKGTAEKDMMIMQVYKNFGYEAPSNDEADAFGLAQMAYSIYHENYHELSTHQVNTIREILDPVSKLIKPKKKKKPIRRVI